MKNKFIRLKIFQIPWSILIALVLFFPGAFCVVSFDSAISPSESVVNDRQSMPSDWEAGVFNHGEYYQWYTPEKHPVFYFASYVILFSAFLFWINAMVRIRIEVDKYKNEQELRKISINKK